LKKEEIAAKALLKKEKRKADEAPGGVAYETKAARRNGTRS
jgi:hypothetical protein